MNKKQFHELKPMDAVVHREYGIWVMKEMNTFHCVSDGKLAELNSEDIVRKVCTKDEILEMIDRVGFITTIKAPNDKVRREFYQQAMDKYDELEWVRVIKTAYLYGRERGLQPYEEEAAKRASEYFHGEAAYWLEIPFKEVEAYIKDKVTSDDW